MIFVLVDLSNRQGWAGGLHAVVSNRQFVINRSEKLEKNTFEGHFVPLTLNIINC
jgi:hypothetical protein